MIASSHLFKALGDPTRLRLVSLVALRGPICVCDLVEVLQLPQSTISRQIAPLRTLGLVAARRVGTWMLYALENRKDALFLALRSSLAACIESEPELREDLERFDLLKRRRELACCGAPALQAAAGGGPGVACCKPEKPASL